MTVFHVQGEPSVFNCESSSLECCKCGALFSRLKAQFSVLKVGDTCTKCLKAAAAAAPRSATQREIVENVRAAGSTLDARLHRVDISMYHPVGQCVCEHWNYRIGPQVARMSRAELEGLTQQQARALRCSHIEAARTAAIDVAIASHEQVRGNGKQLEDKAP